MWTTAVHVFLSWNYASSVSVDRDENEYAADVLSGIQRDTIHSNTRLPVARDDYDEPTTVWGFDHMGNPVLVLPPGESPVSANNPSARYGDRVLQTDVPNEPSLADSARETKSECSENASDQLEGTTTVRKKILKKSKNVRRKYQHGPYVAVWSDLHERSDDDEPNANIDDGIKNTLPNGNVQVPLGVPADNVDASVLSSLTRNDGRPSGSSFKSTKTAKCLDDKLLSALKSNNPYDSTRQQVIPTVNFEEYDEKLHRFLSLPFIRILPPPKMFDTVPQPVLPETFYDKQVLQQQALPPPSITHHSIKPIMRPNTVESPVPPQTMNPEAFFHKQSIVENKRPLFEVNKQQGPVYVQFEPMKSPSAQYYKPACQSTSTLQKQELTSALPETVLCDDRRTQPFKLLQWTAQNQNAGENTYQKDTKSENTLRDRYKPNNVLPFTVSSPGRPTHFVAPTLTGTSFNKNQLQQQQQQWINGLTSPPQNVNTPVIGPLFRPTPTGTNAWTSPQYVRPSRPLVAVSLSPIRTVAEVTEPTPQLSPVEEEISIPQLDDQQQQPTIDLSSAPQPIATSVVRSKVQSIPTERDATIPLSNGEQTPSIELPISPDLVAPEPTSTAKEVSISRPYASTHLPAPPELTKTKAVESGSDRFGQVPVDRRTTPLPYYGQPSQRHNVTRVTGSMTSRLSRQQPQQRRVPARKDVPFSTAGTTAVIGDDVRPFGPRVGNHTPIHSRPGHGATSSRPDFGPCDGVVNENTSSPAQQARAANV